MSKTRKRLPQLLAAIDTDNCTGCEACVAVCPVDCILLRQVQMGVMGTQLWCEIDWTRCIGCRLCIRLPQRKGDVWERKICPWDAIEMLPIANLPQAAERMSGPPECQTANHQRLREIAGQLVQQHRQANSSAMPP